MFSKLVIDKIRSGGYITRPVQSSNGSVNLNLYNVNGLGVKFPKRPPTIRELWDETIPTGTDTVAKIYQASLEPHDVKQYLHWDKLRHRPPPNGLTHREWWLAIKMQRMQLSTKLPLMATNGEMFQYVISDPVHEKLHKIDIGAGGLIQMPEQITNPETKDQYYVGSLIEEAITSSQLEGATTTRQVAKAMIKQGRAPRDKSERMILNNFQTMQRIGKLKGQPLTKDLVFEIHRLVTDQTLEDPTAAGRFRRSDEQVRVEGPYGEIYHEPPGAGSLDERMALMCSFANGSMPADFLHPVIRSIILHFWLSYDHPFVDGNGRTARALFYWSMLHYGYWLAEFISISHIIRKAPVKYGRAFLYSETDDNDATYFIRYHLHVLARAIAELHDYIQRKTKQLRAIEAELRGLAVLNHRQRALIGHALRHPNQRYLVESHRLSHNISYETARTDLLDLADRGLLNAGKAGKKWFFHPANDLEQLLVAL